MARKREGRDPEFKARVAFAGVAERQTVSPASPRQRYVPAGTYSTPS